MMIVISKHYFVDSGYSVFQYIKKYFVMNAQSQHYKLMSIQLWYTFTKKKNKKLENEQVFYFPQISSKIDVDRSQPV